MYESEHKVYNEFDKNKDESTGFKRSVSKQVILCLLANVTSIAPSMSLGFSAIALPVLTDASNPYALSKDEASWFASIASLATPFGCLFSGLIADRYGRRYALYCVNITCFIGWLTLASAYYCAEQQYVLLLLGRLLTGLSTGLSSMPATVYMAEIASAKLRGTFCSWYTIFFCIGVLLVYFLGFVLQDNLGVICLITAVFPCLGIAFIFFLIPESPSWLIRKERFEEAKINMCKIFGTKDYIPEVHQETETLIRNRGTKSDTKRKTLLEQITQKIKYLIKPNSLKAFALVISFFFFQQFSGTFVLVFYAIDIVKEAGVEFDAYLTIVLIGVVQLLASIVGSYISKSFGRKSLSIISGAGMSVCMIALGGYILSIKQGKVQETTQDSLQFLPVVLLIFYFFMCTVGFVPIPFVISAEVFPANIRGTASGVASGIGYFFNFITVKIYPSMVERFDSQGVFFFYGGMSLAGTIFVVSFLPETKGKSLQEIDEYFGKKKVRRGSVLKETVDIEI